MNIRSSKFFVALLFAFATLASLLLTPGFFHLGPDTLQYLESARDIRSGALFSLRPLPEIPLGSMVRTPGFPAILALGQVLSPGDLRLALAIAHLLLAAITLLILCLSFSPSAKTWLVILAFGIVAHLARDQFRAITSEWSALMALLIFFALLYRFFQNPSPKQVAMLSLLTALIILIRPAFSFIPLLLLLLLFFVPRSLRTRAFCFWTLGLLPITAWIGFNFWRLGVLTIAPAGGPPIILLATILGPIDPRPEDPEAFRKFVLAANEKFTPLTPEEFSEVQSVQQDSNPKFTRNAQSLDATEATAKAQGLSLIEKNDFQVRYGLRTIAEHPGKYCKFLVAGLLTMFFAVPSLAVLCVLGFAIYSRRRAPLLSGLTISAVLLHQAHLGFVILLQPLNSRYFELSYLAIAFCALVLAGSLIARPPDRPVIGKNYC